MNKERIYDEQIGPLMAKIIGVCKEHKIAMVCTFSIGHEVDPALLCTSCLTTDEFDPPERYREIVKLIYREKSSPVTMINERDRNGNLVRSTAVLG